MFCLFNDVATPRPSGMRLEEGRKKSGEGCCAGSVADLARRRNKPALLTTTQLQPDMLSITTKKNFQNSRLENTRRQAGNTLFSSVT